MTFYPAFLTTFPSSRFRISYFLPLGGLQDLQYKSGFSSKIMHKLAPDFSCDDCKTLEN